MIKKKVFISHSTANKNIAEQLSSHIEKLGINSNSIFCSSIIGQGVNGDEKLNEKIFHSLAKAKILVYLLSYDFLNSSYCMEELGVGWFLSQKRKAHCFYLVLPDVELTDLHGFVNSKIDKFLFLDEAHKDDMSIFSEGVCRVMRKRLPAHSKLSNYEHTFFSATRSSYDKIKEKKDERIAKQIKSANAIALLEQQLKNKENEIERLSNKIKENNERSKREQLEYELEIISNRFCYLGFHAGVSKKTYNALSKNFWFDMINRVREIEQQLGKEIDDVYLLLLMATVYSANGDMDNAYKNIKKYVRHSTSVLSVYTLENFLPYYSGSMQDVIDILGEKIEKTPEGICQDSYIELRKELILREKSLEGKSKA